jgi:hypothetical protein
MKALSLRQPGVWLVLHAGKTIENRRWNTAFRGEFLIHAAKGMTRTEYREALEFAVEEGGINAERIPGFNELRRGGIVGRARLVGVLPPFLPMEDRLRHRWHVPEQFGFVLEGIEALPFTPCGGALGFWEAPDIDFRRLERVEGAP